MAAAVVELLADLVAKEVNLITSSITEAGKLSSNLKEIQKLIEESRDKRLSDPTVEKWFREVGEISIEIIDALDDWKKTTDSALIDSPLQKVLSLLSALSFNFLCFGDADSRRSSIFNLKELNEKVDLILKDAIVYKLKLTEGSSSDQDARLVTTDFIVSVDSEIRIGREAEKISLMKVLLSTDNEELLFDEGNLKTICIEGIVGIGKTSLARLAFNDPIVRYEFMIRLWVFNPFDWVHVARAILKSLGGGMGSDHSLIEFHAILERIRDCITDKKFLIVLDDVSMKDSRVWIQLKTALDYGAPGSRVLITTRNQRVGKLMGAIPLRMHPLSDPECWLLMSRLAFKRSDEDGLENLREIGLKIAQKCEGMPLIAQSMGALMRLRSSEKEWQGILESWPWREVMEDFYRCLRLVYCELSPPVRRCFRFCSVFPKGKEINVDRLINIWMALGFLGNNEMEFKGLEYVDCLAECFLVQYVSKDGYNSRKSRSNVVKIHGLVHDFAQSLMETENHAESSQRFCQVDGQISYRDLQPTRALIIGPSNKMQEGLLSDEVKNLIQIRYMEIRDSSIKKLSPSICELYHLQTLDLPNCEQLSQLPPGFHQWTKLRHLVLHGTQIKHLPRGLEKLTELRSLDRIAIGKGANKLNTLKNLNKLRGSICFDMEDLYEKEDIRDAEDAEIKRKIHINQLRLLFSGKVRMEVIEALCPPPYLQSLHISGYKGTIFPRWITTSIQKLKVIKLENFDCCSQLPPLGILPCLEEVDVIKMNGLRYVGREFLGIVVGNAAYEALMSRQLTEEPLFPRLRRLSFEGCESWKIWEDMSGEEEEVFSIMPCLQELCLTSCTKLKEVPHRLLSFKAKSLKHLLVDGEEVSLPNFQQIATMSLEFR